MTFLGGLGEWDRLVHSPLLLKHFFQGEYFHVFDGCIIWFKNILEKVRYPLQVPRVAVLSW